MLQAELPCAQPLSAAQEWRVRQRLKLYPYAGLLAEDEHLLSPNVTLDVEKSAQGFQLSLRTSEYHTLLVLPALRLFQATRPGLAAWLLKELDLSFSRTAAFATPQWADRIFRHAFHDTPEGRLAAYRQHHPEQARVRSRHVERVLAQQGYRTTLSAHLMFGRWLLQAPNWSREVAETALCRIPEGEYLVRFLREARERVVPEAAQALCHALPPFLIGLQECADEEAGDPVTDTLQMVGEHWRYHDGTFALLENASSRQALAYLSVVQQHLCLAENISMTLQHISDHAPREYRKPWRVDRDR